MLGWNINSEHTKVMKYMLLRDVFLFVFNKAVKHICDTIHFIQHSVLLHNLEMPTMLDNINVLET